MFTLTPSGSSIGSTGRRTPRSKMASIDLLIATSAPSLVTIVAWRTHGDVTVLSSTARRRTSLNGLFHVLEIADG